MGTGPMTRPKPGVLADVAKTRVTTLAELDAFRRWAGERHDGPVCFDTESAGLNVHRDRHRMTQVGDKRAGFAFGPDWMGGAHEVLAGLANSGHRLGAFNAPYDWRVIGVSHGIWLPWHMLDDGQIVTHMADSAALPKNALNLRAALDIDPSAAVWSNQLAQAMKNNRWDYATIPDDYPGYWEYGIMDAVECSWLLDKHLPEVRRSFSAAYDLDMAYARLCAKMMLAGMMIDVPYIREWQSKIGAWYEQASGWLAANWGITSPDANAQVGAALQAAGVRITKRTATGMPSVNKETLAFYRSEFPHAAPLIEAVQGAKKAGAILNRFLSKFLTMAGPDGVIHYSIHSIGASKTSRSSVTDPPLQTFDRDVPVMRGSFRPRHGCVLASIDASQIELRMAAHFSGDRQLIGDILRCDETGQSFFVNMAGRIYRTEIAKSDPRYTTTKNTVYATIYGSGKRTAAATAGIPVAEIEPIYDGFKSMYPQLNRDSQRLVRSQERPNHRPQVLTLMGRRLYAHEAYPLVDYRIQGSAAEILKSGCVRLDAAGLGDYMRLTIHDEILFEVPEQQAKDVLHAATEILTDRTTFRVPILWEGQIMPERWSKG